MKKALVLLLVGFFSIFSVTSNNSGGRFTSERTKEAAMCYSDIYVYTSYSNFFGLLANKNTAAGTPTSQALGQMSREGFHSCVRRSLLPTRPGMAPLDFTPPKSVVKRFEELKKIYAEKEKEKLDPHYGYERRFMRRYNQEKMEEQRKKDALEKQERIFREHREKMISNAKEFFRKIGNFFH